jgi:hypothetical protein
MAVMVLYKDPRISLNIARAVMKMLAQTSREMLDTAIEVRVVEPLASHNANELHVDMHFRDFGDWSDELLADYHAAVMRQFYALLVERNIKCAYSFFIFPSDLPRSIWGQEKL